MTEHPERAMWMGRPVHELSEDELHAAFCWLLRERDEAMDRAMQTSVAHIHDLGRMARRVRA